MNSTPVKIRKGSLKTRLALMVTVEMIVCILLTYGADILMRMLLGSRWKVPQFAELIFVSLIVGLLITRALSRQFFNPIENLREAMSKVAGGDFSVRLEEKTTSQEIKDVYNGFNSMAKELASTEILKSDFISTFSHEFKTPISAIQGYSTLLSDCDNLDENQREYVYKILYNTKRLSKLTRDTLLMSKLEHQTFPSAKEKYDLSEQIRESVVALEQMWEEKQIEFDIELEEISYEGNKTLMSHVWDNLLSNAIKFNPYGGMIKIRLRHEGDKIIYAISDTGPGISDDAMPHIFNKFYQEDSSRRSEGNGLGLSLVKEILNLEDGEINAENISGGGCRFTVILKALSK